MRVLQICSKPPLPAIDGGCKAMDNITKGLLGNDVEVNILTIATVKHPFKRETFSEDYIRNTKIDSAFIDTSIKIKDAVLNLFSTKSYNITRFYSAEFQALIKSKLFQQQYDVILLEGLFVMPYYDVIKKFSNAKIVYRAHNIEYKIWEQNAASEKNSLKKGYLTLLAKRLKKYELLMLNKVDGIATITENDLQKLKTLGVAVPMKTTPFGIDISTYKISSESDKNTLFYIGSMDWMPNIEAVKWFLKEVLNKVDIPFYLAGKNISAEFLNYQQQNLIVAGEVESATDFMNAHQIMVVPLFSGSGMRIKIVEAMALGKVVIATSLAAEGITCEHKKDILIANTAAEFIEMIAWCKSNPKEIKTIGEEATKRIALYYDNKVIVNNLVTFFKSL